MEVRRPRSARGWLFVGVSIAVIGAGFGLVAARASASSTPPFLITPRALAFGYIPIGSTTASQTITVKNVSGHPQTMSGTGGGAGIFGGSQNCQGQTLAAGASCKMFYAFSPKVMGAAQVTTNGSWNGEPFSITLSGSGIPEFLITPTRLSFGYVKVGGTSAEQTVRVTNLTDEPILMSGTGGGAGEFGGSQNCQGQTLAPGKSCQMFYEFTPSAIGSLSGSTNGTWNGQAFSLKFTGTGTA